ncbi:hypothetical protein ACVW1C_003305 [Bradyrhizobium sp. USDA 4011]
MPKEKSSPKSDLNWVVPMRSKIQQLTLEIYNFNSNLDDNEREKLWPVLGYLIGIAFSLWRAVFLSLPQRRTSEVQEHAHDILYILLETNAVGFTQDKGTRQWMAGYYNNNAILRLSDLYSDPASLAVIKDMMSENVNETAVGWYRPERQSEFSALSPAKQWELAFEAFEMTFRFLKQAAHT